MENIAVSRPRIVPEAERLIQHGMAKTQPRKFQESAKTRGLGASVRPRIVPAAERLIQHGIGKIQPRKPRELMKTRGLGSAARPSPKGTGLIQHLEKKYPKGRTVVPEEEPKTSGGLEERELVKKIAWAALLVSLIALVLFGVYSLRKFSPEVELQAIEKTQRQVTADLNGLKLTVHLEKLKNALMNARTQLLVQNNYPAAESMLATAQQELNTLLGLLPAEKKGELKQALSDLEKMLQEIRKGPLSFDEKLKEIAAKLDKM